MKKLVLSLPLVVLVSFCAYTQGVGIGTATPHSSAALEIKNNGKGLLLPTMTAAQRNAIASPAKGLMVYDTTNNAHYYYTGKQWKPVGSSALKTDSSLNIGKQVGPIKNFSLSNSSQSTSDTTGYLYDDGGPAGNYSSNANQFFTIVRNDALAIILELQELETENPYDSLRITANGATRTYWGSQTDTILIDGLVSDIDIFFNSNSVNNMAGFKLHWKKILIAGNAASGYDSTQKSGWYYNEVKQYMRGGINKFNNWHPDSSGIGSFSFGDGTSAKGIGSFSAGTNSKAQAAYSVALGNSTKALGDFSTAMGYSTTASGFYSTAMGAYTRASGSSSTAMGGSTTAVGGSSTAMGSGTTAVGDASTAMGYITSASGYASTAMGGFTTASGIYSTAMGAVTRSSGSYSTAMGYGVESKSYGGTAIGTFNDNTGNSQSSLTIIPSNRIFEIGNGPDFNTRSNAMTVLQNGNVGIGVLNPGFQLSVANGMNIDQNNANAGTVDNALRFGSNSGEGIASKRTTGGNQFGLDLYTNGASRMSITLNGNVGIGTSSPSQLFSVAAGMNIDQNNANTGTVENSLRFGNNSGEAIASKRTTSGNQFGLDFYTNNTSRMSITQNGNVGIGTSTSNQLFSVATGMNIDQNNANSGTVQNSLRFGSNSGEAIASKRTVGGNLNGLDFYTNSASRMSITNSGNVGIGTGNPDGLLHIKGTNWIKTVFENNTGEARGFIGADNNGTITLASNAYWDGSAWQYPNTGSSMYFMLHRSNNQFEFRVRPDGGSQATAMVIEVGGNVGIGNTAPSERFEVAGNGRFSGNVTVQSNKGIIRNTTSTQLKQVVTSTLVNGPSIGGLATHTQNVTWSEAFGASPVAAYVGNASNGVGWAEVVVTVGNVTPTGCVLYVFNPRNFTVTPTFTINLVATGAQ